jgi:holo-[acyl-carrier protein] synthase
MASIGADIEQISRIAQALGRTPRFALRLFTPGERAYCDATGRPAQHYAARFCAKEAFAKAMGCALSWQEVEVVRAPGGAPSIRVTGHAAEVLGARQVRLSLSHAGDYAMAMGVVEGD